VRLQGWMTWNRGKPLPDWVPSVDEKGGLGSAGCIAGHGGCQPQHARGPEIRSLRDRRDWFCWQRGVELGCSGCRRV
jgi:hypothetical protein